MTPRLYRYVGPPEIAERALDQEVGTLVQSGSDVLNWIRKTEQQANHECVIVTFVIDTAVRLRIADRHSEHVACAASQPVLSAGEMTFQISPTVEVISVSNQSTGYCPEPESWSSVAEALSRAGFAPPSGFDRECAFRRCPACAEVTLIKDGAFECALCGESVPLRYNVQ